MRCAGNRLKTQGIFYSIIGIHMSPFWPVARCKVYEDVRPEPDLQVFTLKTRKTCQTTSTAPVALLPAGLRTGHRWFNAGAGAPIDLCMRSLQRETMHPSPVVCGSGKYVCRTMFAADQQLDDFLRPGLRVVIVEERLAHIDLSVASEYEEPETPVLLHPFYEILKILIDFSCHAEPSLLFVVCMLALAGRLFKLFITVMCTKMRARFWWFLILFYN